jgi:hypothetical protein
MRISPSSVVEVIGFSTSTCLPARSARSARSKCVETGVATITRSTAGSSMRSAQSLYAFTVGYRADTRARCSARRSLTATTWQPGASMKLRTRFGPQYP